MPSARYRRCAVSVRRSVWPAASRSPEPSGRGPGSYCARHARRAGNHAARREGNEARPAGRRPPAECAPARHRNARTHRPWSGVRSPSYRQAVAGYGGPGSVQDRTCTGPVRPRRRPASRFPLRCTSSGTGRRAAGSSAGCGVIVHVLAGAARSRGLPGGSRRSGHRPEPSSRRPCSVTRRVLCATSILLGGSCASLHDH